MADVCGPYRDTGLTSPAEVCRVKHPKSFRKAWLVLPNPKYAFPSQVSPMAKLRAGPGRVQSIFLVGVVSVKIIAHTGRGTPSHDVAQPIKTERKGVMSRIKIRWQ